MGAKEFAEALGPIRERRTVAAIDALLADENKDNPFNALASALDTLASGIDAEAGAAEQHKPKGWQSLAASLRATSGKLRDLAKEFDQLDAAVPSGQRDPKRGIEPGGDPNQPGVAPRSPESFVYRGDVQPSEDEIAAHAERLTAEALAAMPNGDFPPGADVPDLEAARANLMGELDEPAADESGGIPMLTTEQRIEAGLPLVPTAESLAIFSAGTQAPQTPLLDTVHVEARNMLEERRAQSTDNDPFTDPVTPATLAKPLTFADLMMPIHRADLPHWSYSQLETLSACGVKYAAQKLLSMPQVPQWSLVGGRAVHEAIRVIEERILAPGSAPENWGTPAEIWGAAFAQVIAEVAAEAPVPPAQWRASNRGSEGFDWWRVEGESMVINYVELRRKMIDAALSAGARPRRIHQLVDTPVLELELKIDVMGPMGAVPFVTVLDQAWDTSDGQVLIVDVKTGKIPADTFQLGSQALVLAQHMGLPDPQTASQLIQACFYDARKGLFTDAFRPIERHPYDELVYQVHTAEHYRRNGVYRPHASPFCGG